MNIIEVIPEKITKIVNCDDCKKGVMIELTSFGDNHLGHCPDCGKLIISKFEPLKTNEE